MAAFRSAISREAGPKSVRGVSVQPGRVQSVSSEGKRAEPLPGFEGHRHLRASPSASWQNVDAPAPRIMKDSVAVVIVSKRRGKQSVNRNVQEFFEMVRVRGFMGSAHTGGREQNVDLCADRVGDH